jgi:hypothetical protein
MPTDKDFQDCAEALQNVDLERATMLEQIGQQYGLLPSLQTEIDALRDAGRKAIRLQQLRSGPSPVALGRAFTDTGLVFNPVAKRFEPPTP